MTEPANDASIEPKPAKHPIWHFFRRTGPAAPVAIIATALPLLGAGAVAAFATHLAPWLADHGALGVMIFVIGFAVAGGFALVPTYANSILGGWTFKFPIGFPAVMIGLGGAALIGYLVSYRIIGHRVSRVIHEHPRWQVVRDALIGGSRLKVISIVTLIRLSPMLPFETTSVLFASCEVPPLEFIIGTLIGVAPRTAAMVWFASRAHKMELTRSPHGWLFLGIGGLLTLVGVIVIAIVAKHALALACAPSNDQQSARSCRITETVDPSQSESDR